jgi:hypothetical protein
VTAVGVRLCEAPGAPSRGDVRIRIPSDQPRGTRWRVALGDIHLSGDIRSSRLAHRQGRASSRLPAALRRAREMADCTMTGRADQGGSGTRVALNGNRWLAGQLISWKDPL